MDELYARLDKRWVTEIFNVKKTFKKYEGGVDSFVADGRTAEDIMSKILKENLDRTDAEDFAKSCNPEKFSTPSEGTYRFQQSISDGTLLEFWRLKNVECSRYYGVFIVSEDAGCVEFPITQEGKSNLATLQILSKYRSKYGNEESKAFVLPNKGKRFTSIRPEERNADADLKPYHHFILTARIYHPFKQNYGSRRKSGAVLAQVVNLLGEQELTDFRDIIFCVNDYAVPGDRSDNMDEKKSCCNKEIYPSGFLFIEKVFYNDMRNPISKDYSKLIVNWLESLPGKIEGIDAVSMENVKFQDLSIRLGYPYVYVHQGNCEHLIVFSDARLISPADSLVSSEYPYLVYLYKKYSILCNICGHFIALWILHSCDRIPYRMVHICKRCLEMYCYKDKKKLGKFLLYEYIDPSIITHSME